MTGINAAPKTVNKSKEAGRSSKGSQLGCAAAGDRKRNHTPQLTIITMARMRKTIKKLWTPLPARTPTQLIAVSASTTESAATFSGTVPRENSRKYFRSEE